MTHPLLSNIIKQLLPSDDKSGTASRNPKPNLDESLRKISHLSKEELSRFTLSLVKKINNELATIAPNNPQTRVHGSPILQGEQRDFSPLAQQLAIQKYAFDQHAIVSITDKVGRIIYANNLFCERSGYSQQELLGSFHRFAQSKEYPKNYYQTLWSTVQSGKVWHGEIKNLTRSGETYWVFATIVPVLDEDQQPVQYVSIRTDITDRKIISKQLEQERLFLDSLADTVGEGVYATNENNECIFVNREAERILGWHKDELIGQTIHNLIQEHAPDLAEPNQNLKAMYRRNLQGEIYTSDEIYLFHKNGTLIPVEVTSSPLPLGHERSGAVTVFRDISLRRENEAERQKALERAEQATRTKSQFLANMSHEIRTPMNAIIGMSYLTLDTPLDKKQHYYVESIQRSANTLLGVINDILDFSRIEAGRLSVEKTLFELDQTLAQIYDVNKIKAEEKGIHFTVSRNFAIPNHLIGDPLRLTQVLTNLVSNAIKFTQKGNVDLSLDLASIPSTLSHHHDFQVIFTVTDSGIGISDEYKANLFEAFSQADSGTTREFGGTGLGLAISKQLTSLMGGTIDVESSVNKGSSFSLNLPFSAESQKYTAVDELQHFKLVVFTNDLHSNRVFTDIGFQTYLCHPDEISTRTDFPCKARLSVKNALAQCNAIVLSNNLNPQHIHACLTAIPQNQTKPWILLANTCVETPAELQDRIILCPQFTPQAITNKLLNTLSAHVANSQFGLTPHFVALPTQLPNATILLAEDNLLNTEVAQALLESLGMHVLSVTNGQDAIDQFKSNPVDLIFMDLQMPGIDGFEATRQIRTLDKGKDVPIIALTAHAMAGDKARSLDRGMSDHITKPIEPQQLQAALARWLPHKPDLVLNQEEIALDPSLTESLKQFLPSIDFSEGLTRAGNNLELYHSLLDRFTRLHATSDQELKQTIHTNTPNQGYMLAHSIKGIAGNLGLKELYQQASQLETGFSGKQLPSPQAIEAYTLTLCQTLTHIDAALPIIKGYTQATETPQSIPLKELLNRLNELVGNGDIECLSLAPSLKRHTANANNASQLNELSQHIEEFDFEAAEELINTLLLST